MPGHSIDDKRWFAVQRRERSSHDAFVYAVLTTKIFCRPTCPARLARRANVTFFDSASDASKAGFRACKRCKPDHAADLDSPSKIVFIACEQILQASGDLTLAQLAERTKVSARHLHNVFKATLGCTPAAYAASVRNGKRGLSQSVAPSPKLSESAAVSKNALDDYSLNLYCSPSAYENVEALLRDMDGSIDESSSISDTVIHTPGWASLDDNLDFSKDVFEEFVHDSEQTDSFNFNDIHNEPIEITFPIMR